jgi:transcriptional regulator with XRE-family HTH domain
VSVDGDLVALGREVRRLRKERGLSQEELADRSGLHTNYIGGIERGERNVGIKAIFALARGLGVGPRDLFASEGSD